MSNEGKKVKTHYRGTLDDGTEFDSSYSRNEPLEFTCMGGQMIKGFDEAVRDMEVGQTVNVRLSPDQAYGERDENAVIKVPLERMPAVKRYNAGDTVYLSGPYGQPFAAKLMGIEDGIITFDMNHEMAGKYLNFEITLVEVCD